jgi:putative NIF3 family GTP cyclohydrolase 1 type 2
MNVDELIEELLGEIDAPSRSETVDALKTGSPGASVRGVVFTFLATEHVLERAVELGANVIVSHEGVFFSHWDNAQRLEHDDVYRTKRELIQRAELAIFRIHDALHDAKPDGITEGMLEALGWTSRQIEPGSHLLQFGGQTAAEIAASAKAALGLQSVRIAGNPQVACHKVACQFGATGFDRHLADIGRRDVQALVIGEAHEWETYEYVRDAAAQGLHKALIVLGHAASEEAGMRALAAKFGARFPEIAAHFVPAGNSFVVV